MNTKALFLGAIKRLIGSGTVIAVCDRCLRRLTFSQIDETAGCPCGARDARYFLAEDYPGESAEASIMSEKSPAKA